MDHSSSYKADDAAVVAAAAADGADDVWKEYGCCQEVFVMVESPKGAG